VLGFAAALVVSASLPGVAFGQTNVVDDLLNTLGAGGGAGDTGGSGGDAAPAAGVPPTYEPPLHGSNPHGQGTDAAVDLMPSNSNPYPGSPSEGDEEVIVGDSRGEQDADGQYHGTVTLAYLLGAPIIQVQTNEGETKDGPLQPLQDGLDDLCTQSGSQLCLEVLAMHSSTTSDGSSNSFTGANLSIGGEGGINADALSSEGNISDDGNCQTASGESRVAGAGVGAPAGDTLNVAESSSSSTACNNGSQSTTQDSEVVELAGNGIPIPATGCDDGTANTVFDDLSPLVATVCNADDTNSGQTSAPYGVREALTVFAVITGNTSLIKTTTAGPESHAVAPGGGQQSPTTQQPGGGGGGAGGGAGDGAGDQGGNQGPGGDNGADGADGAGGEGAGEGAGGGGSAAGEAAAGDGDEALAFTGADLLVLGLVGGALLLGGLALTTTAGRRHRQTV
jgi:hypothetical protein